MLLSQIFVYNMAMQMMHFVCREEMSQVSTDVERLPPQRPMFTQLLSPTKEVPEGTRVRLDCVLVGRPEPEVSLVSVCLGSGAAT